MSTNDLLAELVVLNNICTNIACLDMLDEIESLGIYRLPHSINRKVCINCYEAYVPSFLSQEMPLLVDSERGEYYQISSSTFRHPHIVSQLRNKGIDVGGGDLQRLDKLIKFLPAAEIVDYYERMARRREHVESRLEGCDESIDFGASTMDFYVKWGQGGYIVDR